MSSKKNFEGLQPRECHQKRNLEAYNPLDVIKEEFWRFTTPWKAPKKIFGGLQPLGKLQKRNLKPIDRETNEK
ncbi:MAG: hypothetical protein LBU44_00355 [Mediterranea sp.]|nr:hypothetical protein [Mediterranea sp.]